MKPTEGLEGLEALRRPSYLVTQREGLSVDFTYFRSRRALGCYEQFQVFSQVVTAVRQVIDKHRTARH